METTTKYFVTDLVSEVGCLPNLAAQVVHLASDPQCDLGSLSKVILSDNVLTMRFLALANSAAVSHGQEVKNLRAALVRLGLQRVRNVALLMGMHDMMPTDRQTSSLDLGAFWKYSLATASCAQGLAWQRGHAACEDAWLAGILHGIGIAVLGQKAEREFGQAVALARREGLALAEAELRTLEFHHGELAGRILKEWNLPRVFAEVVEFHVEDFQPGEINPASEELISVLRDAISLVRTIGFGECGEGTPVIALDDLASALGLAQPALEALAVRVDSEVRDHARLIGLDPDGDLFSGALEKSREEVARLALEGLDDSLARVDLEEQMGAAREIQQRLLPAEMPVVPGVSLAAVNEPSLHVSGDMYDFFRLKGNRQALVIADVSGKGMPASLLASNLQASLRSLARVFEDPGELLATVNNAIFESTDPERFATLFLAVIEPGAEAISYASAGHNPPLLLRADGTVEWLKPAGTPVGMFPDMTYPVIDVALRPGDLLVTYTDGITEAADRKDVEFMETGLEAAVRGAASRDPETVIQTVLQAVRRHLTPDNPGSGPDRLVGSGAQPSGPIDAGDDLTMVVLRRED